MKSSASRVLLFIALSALSALSASHARADEPGADAMAVQVLPTRRTPVHLWPIMRGCTPDPAISSAVAKRLNGDLSLQVHRLAIPRSAQHLSCFGESCVPLLREVGCEKRSGVLVGGEIDEAPCDVRDQSLAGCHGQLISRVRVFRIDLETDQPARGDFRYALCEDQRCGPEGRSLEALTAQLIAELIGAQSLPSPVPMLRAAPELEAQCTAAATPPSAPPLIVKTEEFNKVAILAYYSQYKNINTTNDAAPGAPPTRAQAEADARQRALHFIDGVSGPPGLDYVATAVNGKVTLLPGEELVGNPARIGTLQGFVSAPPAGPAYEKFRRSPLAKRMLLVFVLDQETMSLSVFVIEPGKPLRALPALSGCQAGAGESAQCIAAALAAAAAATTTSQGEATAPALAASSTTVTTVTTVGRPLGCIPFATRSCAAWSCPSDPASLAPPLVASPVAAVPPPAENPQPLKWTTRLLYTAMGVSLATAGILSIADSVNNPTALMDEQGNTATITGLLRPAVWTAWGISLALAVPTVISVVESGRARQQHEALLKPPAPPPLPPPGPRCSIREEHL